jgi:hypothetical protein
MKAAMVNLTACPNPPSYRLGNSHPANAEIRHGPLRTTAAVSGKAKYASGRRVDRSILLRDQLLQFSNGHESLQRHCHDLDVNVGSPLTANVN